MTGFPLVVRGLLTEAPADDAPWREFWAGVGDGRAHPVQIAAVLTAAATRPHTPASFVPLVASLAPEPGTPLIDAVSIVGTGGGPATFNVSTAAALVAAAVGAPVVKSGSRSYSSSRGALDLLGSLDVAVRSTIADVQTDIDGRGIAFVGTAAYPPVFVRLARAILPLGFQDFGPLFNAVGPFVSTIPARAQLTGVSARLPWDSAVAWADACPDRDIWLCDSTTGADEMLSFAPARLRGPRSTVRHVEPGTLVPGDGDLSDLAPCPADQDVVAHLHLVLAGRLNTTATHTVALNAGALLLASGTSPTLEQGVRSALRCIEDGEAGRLLHRLCSGTTVGG